MKRREFLQTAAGLAFAYKFAPLGFAQSVDAHIEIFPDEKLGTISPNVYGHFVENLSGVIYDGIWVGENSKVPNINGIRKALVDEMRKIKPALVRFPGGCFADSYDWRDGVGPVEKRPRRSNFWAVPAPQMLVTASQIAIQTRWYTQARIPDRNVTNRGIIEVQRDGRQENVPRAGLPRTQ